MIGELIILVIALPFLIASTFLFLGKGTWLIAGYNTMTQEEKKQFNEKKLCRAVGRYINKKVKNK